LSSKKFLENFTLEKKRLINAKREIAAFIVLMELFYPIFLLA